MGFEERHKLLTFQVICASINPVSARCNNGALKKQTKCWQNPDSEMERGFVFLYDALY